MLNNAENNRLSRWWLIIGISALAIAGLFACVLVIARTPSLASIPLFTRLFHQSLVVHVDLSVLVWFLAVACLMWSRHVAGTRSAIPYLEESALICFALGTLAIALSPLDPQGEVMMSNYIPVLHSPVFFLGLPLLFIGTALMLVRLFGTCHSVSRKATARNPADNRSCALAFGSPQDDIAGFGVFTAGVITAIALAAFIWSYVKMPSVIDGTQYYELTFWGGGHVLQFTHTQMLMVAWLLLAKALSPGFTIRPRILCILFSIGLLAAFITPAGYIGEVTSQYHRQFFTHLMIGLGGIAPLVLAFWIVQLLWRQKEARKSLHRALWSALLMSVIVFIVGGALGGMIEGQNVVIPAHYHGSIVGVTLAFMGLAWLLLPMLGYRDVSAWKMAYWQPIIYGGGQLLHITGLAWSGGYGVLRKTPGVINEISPAVKAAMGLMGLGGLLAVIGGLLFVIVTAKAILQRG